VTKIYNPSEVTINFSALPFEGGLADGEFVSWAFDSNIADDVVGTDGEVSVSVNNDARATVTLKLMQTSDLNRVLAQLMQLRRRGGGALGIGPFALIVGGTGETLLAPEAWIMKAPDGSLDRTPTAREWQIRLANAEYDFPPLA
jgi:hypothetical protein